MPKKIDALVRKLKQALIESEDFGDIAEIYYDLVEMRELHEMGRPKKNPKVMAMLRQGINCLFNQPTGVLQIVMGYVKRYHFYHGSIVFGDLPGSILYFEDLDMGLLIICRDHATKYLNFLRLTGTNARSRDGAPIIAASPTKRATD